MTSFIALITEAHECGLSLLSRRQALGGGLTLCLIALTRAWAQPQAPMTLKFTRIGQGSALSHLESALTTAYSKLGISVEFIDMPAERAIVESNAGRVDGEMARIAGIETLYPELMRVDVPLYINTNSIFVYGKDKSVPVSLEQLSKLKSVGIVKGWKTSEKATAGWKNIIVVNSSKSAMLMLKLGRFDAFLGRSEDAKRVLQQQDLSPADFPNRVVLHFPLYHYLNRKHEALLPAITRELSRMKGTRGAVVANQE